MPNEINPETILSTTEKPLTLLRWLRAIQKTNAQITEKLTELENTLNGKVAKAGDTMTGDLSVPNINVSAEANVGSLNVEKINSNKINQKYAGAIKSELHVDEQGIVEFVNGSNAGRFDTAKVIKPSEVKTEIYDNQEGKRMFFRLPYLEASAGEHRLLTEEDLGGGGSSLLEDIEDEDGHKRFAVYNGTPLLSSDKITDMFAKASLNGYVLSIVCFYHKQNNITLQQGTYLCEFELPQWIYDLIITNPDSSVVLRTNYAQWASGDDPAMATGNVIVSKTDGKLKLRLGMIDNQPDRKTARIEFSISLGA